MRGQSYCASDKANRVIPADCRVCISGVVSWSSGHCLSGKMRHQLGLQVLRGRAGTAKIVAVIGVMKLPAQQAQ